MKGWSGGEGGGQTDPLPQKKTTLKKPGLIRDEAYSAVIRGGSHSWLENRWQSGSVIRLVAILLHNYRSYDFRITY